jgi:hypothetical protein
MLNILVVYDGDPSAGIPSATWEIIDVELEDDEHREEVRAAFSGAFELITGGGHRVLFTDEIHDDEQDDGQLDIDMEGTT